MGTRYYPYAERPARFSVSAIGCARSIKVGDGERPLLNCGLSTRGGKCMKKLYIVGGAMGVGKTAACQMLKRELPNAVFLDGDWCWDADPFQVTEETKAMVLDNICYLLNSFLRCGVYENVIFCWVMDRQYIIDSILERLDTAGCRVVLVSLIIRPEELSARLEGDIAKGLRQRDIIERSCKRLKLYDELDTVKIDVSGLTIEETAEAIANA